MMTNASCEVQAFWDILIPGTATWPSASKALDEGAVRLAEADELWVRQQAALLAQVPPDSRTGAMQQVERAEPERFGRVLGALYEAYYTSAKAHAAVLRLAEASPREASPSLDETLLAQVIATRAGQRRL